MPQVLDRFIPYNKQSTQPSWSYPSCSILHALTEQKGLRPYFRWALFLLKVGWSNRQQEPLPAWGLTSSRKHWCCCMGGKKGDKPHVWLIGDITEWKRPYLLLLLTALNLIMKLIKAKNIHRSSDKAPGWHVLSQCSYYGVRQDGWAMLCEDLLLPRVEEPTVS